MNRVPFLTLLFAIIGHCHAVCPHEESGLAKFSETYSQTGNLENTEIDITGNILLDIPNVSIKRLIISSDGKLVFGRGIDITLRTKAILVKDNGQFIIGSKDCRHTDNVNIILQGIKSEFPELLGPGGEEKYFIVQDQGVLNIHGAEKRAWTKITSTLERWEYFSDDPTLIKYNHKASSYESFRRGKKGLAVYRINPDYTIAGYTVVDLNNIKKPYLEQEEVDAMIATIDNLPTNQIVSIAVHDFLDPASGTDLSGLFNKIEEVTGMQSGELLLRQSGKYDAFTLMFIKGGTYTQSWQKSSIEGLATASSYLDVGDYRITSTSHIQDNSLFFSRIDLRIVHESIVYQTATVVHDVTSWNKGDQVIITSTDFDARHIEVKTIKDIIPPNKVVLSGESLYRHFGEIENRVDMRAEIALLTRNIKIQGEVQDGCPAENGNCDKVDFDSFGGQIKISHSFSEVYIEGVELFQMGQLGVIGAYPIHFHMCLNVTDKTSIIESNSIHHSNQRAVTVHGTFGTSVEKPGVVLKYNVAYNVLGHTFFLEDGSESATILIGNLGALTMNIDNGFFATDATEAATFWITNPEVVLIGNVAAGSVGGTGFWYVFPEEPVGSSTGVRYQKGEAFQTPIWECDNNVAHSNDKTGFLMSRTLVDSNGNVGKSFTYIPRVDPLDKKSAIVDDVQVRRVTAYKNKRRNVWAKGGVVFMQVSSAESKIGIALARATHLQQQFASKLILIGVSEGNNEDESYPDAYTLQAAKYYPGIELIYGPQYVSKAWFTGYKSLSDGSFVAGGIGFNRRAFDTISQLTSFREFRFGQNDPTEGNNVFNMGPANTNLGYENQNGNELQSFRDVDGSIYGCDQLPAGGPKQFVKPEKYLLTDNCYCRANWQMCVCDDLYGSAQVMLLDVWSGSKSAFDRSIYSKRVKYSDPSDTAYENYLSTGSHGRALMVLGNQEYYYEVEFLEDFPKRVKVEVEGVERDNNVVVGMCIPEGATLSNMLLTGWVGRTKIQSFTMGSSLQDVGSDTSMHTIYIEGRMLYLHFATNTVRDLIHDSMKCIDDPFCPKFYIQMTEDLPYTPCFTPTAAELSTDFMPELATQLTCNYTAKPYGADWGVGDTFASHDGAWGEWSVWSSCTSSSRTRTRSCDSPVPYGDGANCSGISSQTESC